MKIKAKEFIKKELKKNKISYVRLAIEMEKKGYSYSSNTIRSKINRGSFSFAFLLEICDSLDIDIFLKPTNGELTKILKSGNS